MFIGNLIAQWQESVLTRSKVTQFFYYSFFLGRTAEINCSSAFFWIAYRWWNIFYLVIHMKMDCTIIKAEKIARWYILIKFIVNWKEGKRCISNYWIIWRDGIFVFGCSRLMVVDKKGQLFLLHLVTAIISILTCFTIMSSDADYSRFWDLLLF